MLSGASLDQRQPASPLNASSIIADTGHMLPTHFLENSLWLVRFALGFVGLFKALMRRDSTLMQRNAFVYIFRTFQVITQENSTRQPSPSRLLFPHRTSLGRSRKISVCLCWPLYPMKSIVVTSVLVISSSQHVGPQECCNGGFVMLLTFRMSDRCGTGKLTSKCYSKAKQGLQFAAAILMFWRGCTA